MYLIDSTKECPLAEPPFFKFVFKFDVFPSKTVWSHWPLMIGYSADDFNDLMIAWRGHHDKSWYSVAVFVRLECLGRP
jgi:hypothetical protein